MISPQKNLEIQIQELVDRVKKDPQVDLEWVEKAIDMGRIAHDGQYRKTGDKYFIHPVRVAIKAIAYNLDSITIIASLLHDVIEDTEGKRAQEIIGQKIRDGFGENVYGLVNALTKVKENQNLTLFKIIQLGSVDFRVILIKLLDRLDNLSDLKYLPRAKQRRICQETIAVYCEIAHGLGLIEIEEQLKEYAFKHLYPVSHKRIARNLKQFYDERHKAIHQIIQNLQEHIEPQLQTSIKPQYLTPQAYLFDRHEIVKILNSISIKTTNAQNCYQVLGAIHTHFRSVPMNIYDYISNPKANGWRGLSTKVIINGEQIQINIVTEDFHNKNRKGVLALIHEGIYHSENYREFLQLFLDVASDNTRIEDVLRISKTKTIQTMTPAGDVVELRYGATILDFAFMVHTELGLKSAGGIIDNVRYPRSKILEDGMMVKVIKSDSIITKREWIKDAVMPKSIREILKYVAPKQAVKGSA
ncbi:MAG: bifunctional (p)ppGpp synthetase/guanosine-3',5'-bis(diphosphate) 3'-pyrophosphohydrolase [SAR324 cluster bacterium]|nr:bifunctional (p)ppGpp synthetase/guanosine-3',5'-bis(diphosphate) 3'-pyrophosphohydrolase [SAR324 cluster bacterium]